MAIIPKLLYSIDIIYYLCYNSLLVPLEGVVMRGYYNQKFANYWYLQAGVLMRSYLSYMATLIATMGILAFGMSVLNEFGLISDNQMSFFWDGGFVICSGIAFMVGFGYFVRNYDKIGWIYRMKQRHAAEMDRVRAMEDLARINAEDRTAS